MRPTLYELAVVALFASTLAIVVGKSREADARVVPAPAAEESHAITPECAYDSDCEHSLLVESPPNE